MNMTDGITIAESLYITLFSMLIVFAALAAIALILSLFKFIGTDGPKVSANQAATKTPLVSTQTVEPTTTNFEVEVAIAVAAIEAFSGVSADNFVVRNIRKLPQDASSWALAGRQANTQQLTK